MRRPYRQPDHLSCWAGVCHEAGLGYPQSAQSDRIGSSVTFDAITALAAFGSAAFPVLRPAQTEVFTSLAREYAAGRDLGIELPTGSGKTLIGLLLAHESMQRGESAAYLVPNQQLARQVAGEAERLGLAVDVLERPLNSISVGRRHSVNTGRCLGILNYYAYFSEADVVDPPALLILDDAHLAEDAVSARYSIVIERGNAPDEFAELIDLIATEAPGYPIVDDLAATRSEVSPQVQLVAFGDVARVVGGARAVLDRAAAAEENIRYPYRRIASALDRCLWLVEPDAITIRPLRYPLSAEPRFADAGRRVYMSATLGDLDDLRRRLGTPAITLVRTGREGDVPVPGRRILLVVDEPTTSVLRADVRARLSAATPRRVYFCRSLREAREVREQQSAAGHDARILDRDGRELNWFRTAGDADLVLANRYDGIDFAGDAARLAFFPSAPYGTDPFDEFLAANFPGSGFLTRRLAERMTQALGRMTRGDDDWAVCVLEVPEIGRLLTRRDVISRLPVDLAREVDDGVGRAADGIEAGTVLAERILRGDIAPPRPGAWSRPAAVPAMWQQEWSDWEAAFGDAVFAGTFDTAVAAATRLLGGLGNHSLRSWWLYLKAWAQFLSAEHDHRADRLTDALATLGSAVRAGGPTTWFGRVGASANRLGAPIQPLRAGAPLADFVAARTGPELERWQRDVDRGLRSGIHDPVATAWTDIGMALGFDASQPGGSGATDSRWRGENEVVFWEAKIDHEPGARLSRRDVSQLLGQIEEERLAGQPVYGAFLTHLNAFHPDVAGSAANLTIFSLDGAIALWERVRAAQDEVAAAGRAGHVVPDVGPPSGWMSGLLQRMRGGSVGAEDVSRAWIGPRRP